MRSILIGCTLASLSMAVNREVLDALKQYAPYRSGDNHRSEKGYKNRDNYRDYDSHDNHYERHELTVKEKAALAAIKDPILALKPKVRELIKGSGIMEPIMDPAREAEMIPPIFLTDPKFTGKNDGKERYSGHDCAGGNPVSYKWPLVEAQVQDHFYVSKDCTCHYEDHTVYFDVPKYRNLKADGQSKEPRYSDESYRIPKYNQHTAYEGDDFGGYNIPFPYPRPPTPHEFYADCFVNIATVGESHYDGEKSAEYVEEHPADYDGDHYDEDGDYAAAVENLQFEDVYNAQSQYGIGHVKRYGADEVHDVYGEDNYHGDDDYHGDDYHDDDYHGDDYHGDDYHGDDYHGDDYHGDDYHGDDYHGDDYGYGDDDYGYGDDRDHGRYY